MSSEKSLYELRIEVEDLKEEVTMMEARLGKITAVYNLATTTADELEIGEAIVEAEADLYKKKQHLQETIVKLEAKKKAEQDAVWAEAKAAAEKVVVPPFVVERAKAAVAEARVAAEDREEEATGAAWAASRKRAEAARAEAARVEAARVETAMAEAAAKKKAAREAEMRAREVLITRSEAFEAARAVEAEEAARAVEAEEAATKTGVAEAKNKTLKKKKEKEGEGEAKNKTPKKKKEKANMGMEAVATEVAARVAARGAPVRAVRTPEETAALATARAAAIAREVREAMEAESEAKTGGAKKKGVAATAEVTEASIKGRDRLEQIQREREAREIERRAKIEEKRQSLAAILNAPDSPPDGPVRDAIVAELMTMDEDDLYYDMVEGDDDYAAANAVWVNLDEGEEPEYEVQEISTEQRARNRASASSMRANRRIRRNTRRAEREAIQEEEPPPPNFLNFPNNAAAAASSIDHERMEGGIKFNRNRRYLAKTKKVIRLKRHTKKTRKMKRRRQKITKRRRK